MGSDLCSSLSPVRDRGTSVAHIMDAGCQGKLLLRLTLEHAQ